MSIVDDLRVVSATEVENADPRAIRLVCTGDVRYAKTIGLNGINTTDFSVVSGRTLLVFPDSTFEDTTVAQMTITVVSSRWTSGERVRLIFSPTLSVTKVEGVQKLIQQLVKSMLSNSGSNRFNLAEGGDVLRALGLTLDPGSRAQIAAVFAEAASRTEQHFIAAQAGRALPPSEKLLSFQFAKISFDSKSQQAVAHLSVVTYAGQAVSVPLVL